MLKLNHKAMRGTNISDVLFPGLPIVLDKLLAFGREFVFPRAVPFCFRFPPMVAAKDSPMRPMVDSDTPTPCDHCRATSWAFGRQVWGSFSTFSSNDSKFHLYLLNGQSALNRLFDRAAVSRRRLKRISFWLVLASRQRWPEEICRWLLNGGCCAALCSK